MAAPSFVAAGTGQVYTTGSAVQCTLTGTTVGNLIVFHALADDVTATSISVTPLNLGAGRIESLAASIDSFTVPSPENRDVGSPVAANQFVRFGRVQTGGTITAQAFSSGPDIYFRMYEFSNVATGTALSNILENSTAGSIVNGAGTGTTVSDTGVTTLGPDRLACNFVGINDDNALVAFTGETGGDWGIAADFGSSTGTDGEIGLQTAAMASAGTINGGTYTQASDAWGVIGFALIGTTVDVTLLPSPTNFGAHAIFQPTM